MKLEAALAQIVVLALVNCQDYESLIRHEHDGRENSPKFTNYWIVELDDDGNAADLLAKKLGFVNRGAFQALPGHYLMFKTDHPDLTESESEDHMRSFQQEIKVLSASQLFNKVRAKRDPYDIASLMDYKVNQPSFKRLRRWPKSVFNKRAFMQQERTQGLFPSIRHQIISELNEEQSSHNAQPRTISSEFNDPLWPKQWYMHDDGVTVNLNLVPVRNMNITGRGVRVLVVDDGLAHEHPDFAPNYDPDISTDLNSADPNDRDPSPGRSSNNHGTKCAGVIAMVENNEIGGLGIAYNAKVGGVRMLDGSITDATEAESLSYAIDRVDIYSASWGPTDDGKTLEGPGKLTQKAIIRVINEGRDGKGGIFVWADGNGGAIDSCSCDGYVSSIFTISIGATSYRGSVPSYLERCASTMAVVPSGTPTGLGITSIDVDGSYTTHFSGTSAAAPQASAIYALVLEANPNLGWRDMQHLTVRTSGRRDLLQSVEWTENEAGLLFSHEFGFGLMDAAEIVTAAKNYKKNVGTQLIRTSQPIDLPSERVRFHNRGDKAIRFTFDVDDSDIKFLEHVEVIISMVAKRRGCLTLDLVSPYGTRSHILPGRIKDHSQHGYHNWKLMSLLTWGENPTGKWVLDASKLRHPVCKNVKSVDIGEITLVLYGTAEEPEIAKKMPPQKST